MMKYTMLAGKMLCKILQQGRRQYYGKLLLTEEKDPLVAFRRIQILELAEPLELTDETRTKAKVGDIVYVRLQVGTPININNKEYLIIQPYDIELIEEPVKVIDE